MTPESRLGACGAGGSRRTVRNAHLCLTLVLAFGRPAAALSRPGDGRLVRLAQPGSPAVVVAPSNMEDQVVYAVTDLTNYLSRITGQAVALVHTNAPTPFAIHVGNLPVNRDLTAVVAQERLGRDGFVLDVSGTSGVRILGGSKFGTAYGVYELLERLGVRWLAPGAWGEVVPHNPAPVLPAGRFTDRPAFNVRALHAARVGRPFGDWARRLRHNRSGFGGHSGFASPKRYGAAHPEWYAEIDGKRQVDEPNFKLCHSNTGLVAKVVEEVLAELRERREDRSIRNHIGYLHLASDYDAVSISPTDGGGFCRCANCQAQGPLSDRLQGFANTVADAVCQEFPDYHVGYYGAYSEHQAAPAVPAHSDVVVYMTTWTKAFFEPLSAPGNRAFREKVEAFAARCPKLAIRDYDGLAVWWGYGPFTLADVHAADYRWYRDHGVQGVVTEAHTGWGPWGCSYYLTSKLWWNPDADLAALKEDYVRSAYGEAADPMRRYHRRLDEARVYPPPSVLYAMRQDLEEATRIPAREDVRGRIDALRAYYLLLDTYSRMQNGQAGANEVATALRVFRSIDPYVSPLRETHFLKGIDATAGDLSGFTADELRARLDQVRHVKPREVAVWRDGDDARLTPLASGGTNGVTDMGANYRYGPHVMLIHARSGERIRVWQQGPSRTEYELAGPEQAVIAQGTATNETIIDQPATSEGIYRLTFSTRGNRPRIHIANRGAVVKAGGALQHLHPMHRAVLYFFVPRGTRTFTVVTKAEEPLTLELFGPHDAPTPVLPKTTQRATSFEEHAVEVPPGADGCAWRIQLGGEDKKVFLQGVPPFLASHPERLLVPQP